MPKKRHCPEDIIAKLREANILIIQGCSAAKTIRRLEVSDVTYYRWRKEYGGMKSSQIKRQNIWRKRINGFVKQFPI